MNIKQLALEAEVRIRPHIRETPLEHSPYLSRLGNCKVYLKLENMQISGSFKFRGATNIFLSLTDQEKNCGVATASSGNHGAAVAYLLDKFNCTGTIYLPDYASPAKVEELRLYQGVELQFHGSDCIDTENYARAQAQKNHQTYIPPYNHPLIVAGQATCGIELQKQLPDLDAVLVPVGGGGLICGIAGYLKSDNQNVEIIGCQPQNSAVMYESIKAGHILDMPSKPTISDGSAGGIEPDSITFDICRQYVDDFILTSEQEIIDALKLILEKHYMLVEGSGALAVASFVKEKNQFENKNVVLVISGKKIALDTLKKILCAGN
ncbi:threonine/serine dehydratase [Planctomycetota bacterium]